MLTTDKGRRANCAGRNAEVVSTPTEDTTMADYTIATRFTPDDHDGVNELALIARVRPNIHIATPQYETVEEWERDVRTLNTAIGKDWLKPEQMAGLERFLTRMMVQCQLESRWEHWVADVEAGGPIQPEIRENNPLHMASVIMEARAQQYEIAREALGVVQRAANARVELPA